MTSIVGVSAIQELRSIKGFEEAIIAGGFCRDSVMGGTIKDLDVFIPCTSSKDFQKKVTDLFNKEEDTYTEIKSSDLDKYIVDFENTTGNNFFASNFLDNGTNDKYVRITKKFKVKKEFGSFKDLLWEPPLKPGNDYGEGLSTVYSGRYDCNYKGFLDCDLIGYSTRDMPEGMSFGDYVISDFHFGIDRIYSDGEITYQSKEFERDSKYMTATLLKLNHIESLPNAIAKFSRLKTKYPKLLFKTNCLEIKDRSDKKEENIDISF